MENIAGKWNFAYDWHNTGSFLVVRLVINPNGHFHFPDFSLVEGRWAQIDGNVIMKLPTVTDTSYSGSTVGYVMMGMIEEQYTEVPLSATGTWFAFRADSEIRVLSSWNFLPSKRDVKMKKWTSAFNLQFIILTDSYRLPYKYTISSTEKSSLKNPLPCPILAEFFIPKELALTQRLFV